MKLIVLFGFLFSIIFINNKVSTFSLLRNIKSKQLPSREAIRHYDSNNNNDVGCTCKNDNNKTIQSFQKIILTSLLGFQMLNSFRSSSSPAVAATIIKTDAITIDTEAIENELKKESEPIFVFLKKSLEDVKNGIPLPKVLNNVKVAFRNKQFYVDFDMPTIDSFQLSSSFNLDKLSIPPLQLNQKPLLTTTISTTSTSTSTPVKPYWKDIADELNNNLNDNKLKDTMTELNDSVNSLIPTLQSLLHDWRFLLPAGLLIVVIADTLQSLNQYKQIVNDQVDDISELQKRINKEKEEKLLATQLLKEKEAKEKELQLLAEKERKKQLEIEMQLNLEMIEKKKLEAEMKLTHEIEFKKKIENEAKSLATKGSRIFTDATTKVINELSSQASKLSSSSSLLPFEELIVGPVKETEAKLVLEIKSKKLSESDSKFLIESVAKELNPLILKEMKVIEKTWQQNQAKREYDTKRNAEEAMRRAKVEEMKRLNELAVLKSTATSSSSNNNNNNSANNVNVQAMIPVAATLTSSFSQSDQGVNQLISQTIQEVEESVELAQEAEEIAEEEAKQLHQMDKQNRRESIDQNVSEYKAAYEAKRKAEEELRKEKLEEAKRKEMANASLLNRKSETIVVKPTIISSAAENDEDFVDDSELIAEVEAIMLLEEEALRKLDNETIKKVKEFETTIVSNMVMNKKTETLDNQFNSTFQNDDNAALLAVSAPAMKPILITLNPIKASSSSSSSSTTTAITTISTPPKKRVTKPKSLTTSVASSSAPITLKAPPTITTTTATITTNTSPAKLTSSSMGNVSEVIKSLRTLTPSQLRRRTRSQLEDDAIALEINKQAGVNLDELNKESIAVLIEKFIYSV